MEVITISHHNFDYNIYLDYAIEAFRDESSIYDGKGGMSHIVGRVCGHASSCGAITAPKDIRRFLVAKGHP